jgi:hypothetical protein
MPGVRGVLVAVAPFPASIGAGHLGAAQRACLLADLAECYGKLIVCHLRDPLRCRLAACAAWRAGVLAVVAAVPAAGCSRGCSLRPADSAEVGEMLGLPERTVRAELKRRGQA